MAISFVGSHIGTHAAITAQTVNFSSLLNSAGTTPTLAQNDLVVITVFQAQAGTTAFRTQAQLTPTGYTASHANVITSSDTNDSSQQTSHKFMGATPDTSVSIPASFATTSGVAYSIHVYRGVDPTTPMDVAGVTASGGNGAQPDPAAITPATAGAWIYVAGGGAMATGTAPQSAAPTGLDATTNAWRQTVLTTTTNDPGLAAGHKSNWASGAFDCPAFTGYTTTNSGSWTAVSLAIRPADVTPPTITSTNSVSVASGATLSLSLTANETVTWAIRTAVQDATSADAAQFQISGSTLQWSSNGTRDVASPADANADNAYIVVVRATDTSSNVTDQTITVTVTAANRAQRSNASFW